MKTYMIEIVGTVPMLWHHDNLDFADDLAKWREDNRDKGKRGDDRSPAWSWVGSIYHDGEHFALPQDVLSSNLMHGAAKVTLKGNKSFKALSQSGILIQEPFLKLYNHGQLIPWKAFEDLIAEKDFFVHRKTAEKYGFRLFVKRARIGQSKHVRVRPRFDQWALKATLDILDDQITLAKLTEIFKKAGFYVGLGDWRPGSPKSPGPWGRYEAKIELVAQSEAA